MKKLLLIIFSCILFYSCSMPTEASSDGSPKTIFNSNNFKLKPIGIITEKVNDSTYIARIDSQWQTFERLEVEFDYIYPGVKCSWSAHAKIPVIYTHVGQKFLAPIINGSSYFVDKHSSTIMSFYREFLNDTVVVGAAVLSEDGKKTYISLLYFIVKSKN